MLLLQHGSSERFAVPLRSIRRIVWLDAVAVQRLGQRSFAAIDGVPTQLVRINDLTDAAPDVAAREAFALLPRGDSTAVGLLVSQLLDTAEVELPDELAGPSKAAVRTVMVDAQVTRLVDLDHLTAAAEVAAEPHVGKGRHILLVEDTRFFRELVRGYLEAAGYQVTEAHHGRAGLDGARARLVRLGDLGSGNARARRLELRPAGPRAAARPAAADAGPEHARKRGRP